jgi:hypothetical protein
LNLTTPSALGWSTTLTGLSQQVVDATAADQSYTVNDARGSGAGWNVTVSATTFTDASSGTLPDSGTFSGNGSTSSQASTTAPSSACTVTGQCTAPTNAVTYPVAITTAASTPTASTIYSAAAGTGIGSVLIGGTTPVGWWISLPGTAAAGTYTSTVDLNVATGP